MPSGIVPIRLPEVDLVDLRTAARRNLPRVPSYDAGEALFAWRDRMIGAYRASLEMSSLAAHVCRVGLFELRATCEAFAREARAAAVGAASAVEALGGAAVFRSEDLVVERDMYEDEIPATQAEAVARLFIVASLEAIACASRLGPARARMPGGDLLALVTRMHVGESRRARFSWRAAEPLTRSLAFDAKVRLAELLSREFGEMETRVVVLSGGPPSSEEDLALGLVRGASVRRAFYAAVQKKILPALERAGVRADIAWAARSRLFATTG